MPRVGDGIICCFAVFICFWYGGHFTSQAVASVDLPGHIAITERLLEQLSSLRLRFFDPYWFSGWPAFQFYAFFAHLLVAALSIPLAFFSTEPVRLACHLLLLACCAGLPFSMRYAARVIAQELFADEQQAAERYDFLLSLMVCTVCFWFLNHDRQWYGIGGAALFNVGLLSQGLAWHFFLLHLGCLARLVHRGRGYRRRTSLVFFLLVITHTLTAVCSLFIALVFLFRFPKRRGLVAQTHIWGLGLAGFWLVPLVWFAPQYLGQDIFRPAGDFLEIFFRYPLYALYRTMQTWLNGSLQPIDVSNLVALALVIVGLWSSYLQKSRIFSTLGLSLLLALLVFSSGFVATSLPFGFHYYRFYGHLFLLACLLLSVVPLAWIVEGRMLRVRKAILVLFSLLIFFSTLSFPHYEREQIAQHRGDAHLSSERAVLQFLGQEPDVGRVMFAYFNDYQQYTFLSAHYMQSRLGKEFGLETLNGLFIQSSLAYRFPVATASLLGIPGYHIPLLFIDRAKLSDRYKLKQLQNFGVTHLVVGAQHLSSALQEAAIGVVSRFGPYAIVRIAEREQPRITTLEKRVIAYFDAEGNLPFRFLEFFFHAREQLDSRFELIEAREGKDLPLEIAAVLVNGQIDDDEIYRLFPSNVAAKHIPIVRLEYRNHYLIDHYAVWYQHNVELDEYNQLEQYLESEVKLADVLFPLRGPAIATKTSTPALTWSSKQQELFLEQLQVGRLYRINYSYFPYWQAERGTVFRGSGERLFFVPQATSASLGYEPFSHRATWIGYALSLFSCFILLLWRVPAAATR